MRFKKGEYDDFQVLIDQSELSKTDFRFVKRRGSVHVSHNSKANPFTFFRKKEAIINQSGKFEDRETYFIGAKKDISTYDWQEVLNSFKNWLKND